MKLALQSFLLTSLFSFSVMNATFDITDHADESLLALVLAAKDYGPSDLPNITARICEEVKKALPPRPRRKELPFKDATKNEIKKALSTFPKDVKHNMYHELTSEDKKIAVEGLFILFMDVNEDQNLKIFIDRLLYIIFTGQTFNEIIAKALTDKKVEVNYIRDYKLGISNILTAKRNLAARLETILKEIPEEVQQEFLYSVEKRKKHYTSGTNEQALIDKIYEMTRKRLERNK